MSDYSKIYKRIWSDPDFIALDARSQQLFFLLLSYPTRNYAGVIPLTIRRWAACTRDGTPENVTEAINALAEAGFVLVDWDTEEGLIRTYIRNDEVYRQPNLMKRALQDVLATSSRVLGAALAFELRNLPAHKNDDHTLAIAKSLVVPVVEGFTEGFAEGYMEGLSEGIAEPIPEPPGVGVGKKPAPTPTPTPAPVPIPPNPPSGGAARQLAVVEDKPIVKAALKGHRLAPDWVPSDSIKEDLRQKYPGLKLGLILEEFRDYWLAIPGQRGHKLDWDRTFRNRVREMAGVPRFQRAAVGGVDAKALEWHNLK